ncbi:MAG: DHH family phosphoesterase [Nanoarchaeota archaeon]
MMNAFLKAAGNSARAFQASAGKQVRLISHIDCDGMTSAAILIRAFNRLSVSYSLSIVQQLNTQLLMEIANDRAEVVVFSDLGSGQLGQINGLLKNKQVFILDHHEPLPDKPDENVYHLNPHLYGIDGGKAISGAGVCYQFAKALDEKNRDAAHLAIIGAIGDVQEVNGFLPPNDAILQEAIAGKNMIVSRGLRFFGQQTKPLHKILEFSTDPYIPDVSGSESGAIQFLQQLGINPKRGTGWKKIMHLTDKEQQSLIEGIVLKRDGMKTPEDILGNMYILPKERPESPFREAREFSTLLNACGRLNKASIGIGACLGDKKAKQRAMTNLVSYKRAIINGLRWYERQPNTSRHIFRGKGYVIINAEDNILGTIAGTMASILTKSGSLGDTLVISMAQQMDNTTKVSLRKSGENSFDLRDIVNRITALSGGESGGHANAAGAIIQTEHEDHFISCAKDLLDKLLIEETISD